MLGGVVRKGSIQRGHLGRDPRDWAEGTAGSKALR